MVEKICVGARCADEGGGERLWVDVGGGGGRRGGGGESERLEITAIDLSGDAGQYHGQETGYIAVCGTRRHTRTEVVVMEVVVGDDDHDGGGGWCVSVAVVQDGLG